MTRELKFKIWDPESKLLIRSDKIDISDNKGGKKILQYTGLKDKFGAEIFDEDVIRLQHRKYTVVWDNERAGWGMKDHESILIIPLLPERISESTRIYNHNESENQE